MTMFSLAGRTAVVTGGSQGLGRGIALALARQGADVAISFLARRDDEATAGARTRDEIAALGRTPLLVEADMTAPADVERLRDEVIESFGRVDVVVNNVGGFPTKPLPLIELTDEDWARSIDLNLNSAFLCCRAFGRTMTGQGSGRIVSISASLSAFTGVPACAHYGAAKAGVVTMTKALARELAPFGVTVNAVAPGHVETPMNRHGVELGWWDEEDELAGIALGRGGTVDDVAAAVCFFASDEAGWITGQTLNVNGGSYLH
jgi:NAD(P)-dependent dehydrogenase (short-subunit alcohol dehydrogenase family)